ncbi:MAG: family 4 glycosyl hydrolase, partial [Promethearchaeota archaeon]
MERKITLIGAGGRVSTTATAQFARFNESEGIKLVLHDINRKSVKDTMKIAMRAMDLTGVEYKLENSDNLKDAVKDSDLILFCAKNKPAKDPPFNLTPDLGNAVLLNEIAKISKESCGQNTFIINFANPTDKLAMMVKTLHPDVNIASLCTGPEEFIRTILLLFEIPLEKEDDLNVCWVGCNHYAFIPKITIRGEDAMPRLKKKANFNWRIFKGLREFSDNYDLATNLSLLSVTDLLTAPLGHVNFYHKGVPGVLGSHRFRPTKEILIELCTGNDPDFTEDLFWELMDSWGTRQVAKAALGTVELLKNKEFFLQLPNKGYLDGLEDGAFIETPGTFKDGEFLRKKFDIPPLIKYMVIHEAKSRYLISKAIARMDYKNLIIALMLRNDQRISIPKLRKYISEKWNIKDDISNLYNFT